MEGFPRPKPPALPDNKVVRVDLGPTAAVQKDPRVAHDGAAPVMLVFHGGYGWQETVEIFWDVCGAVTIKNIVDDISRFQRALQNWDISLRVKESQNIFSVERENNVPIMTGCLQWSVKPCGDNCGEWWKYLMRWERVLLKVQLFDECLAVLLKLGWRWSVSVVAAVRAVGFTCSAAFLNDNNKSC